LAADGLYLVTLARLLHPPQLNTWWLQAEALAVLGLVVVEVAEATKLLWDLPFQHQLLTPLPLVQAAPQLLPVVLLVKVTTAQILCSQPSLQQVAVAVAVILWLLILENLAGPAVVAVIQELLHLTPVDMVQVLLGKVIMVGPVLIVLVARVAAAVAPVQSDLVYQPDRIPQMPVIQVVPTAELVYLHQ